MIVKLEKIKRIVAFSLALIYMLQAPVQVLADSDVQATEFEFLEEQQKASEREQTATESDAFIIDREETIATESDALCGVSLSTAQASGSSISDELYWAVSGDELLITTIYSETEGYADSGELDAREPEYNRDTIPWADYLADITEVTVGGKSSADIVTPYYMNGWFDGMENLTEVNFNGVDTSSSRSFIELFKGCDQLSVIDLSGFNTSKAVDMTAMFKDCRSLQTVNLTGFNTAKVKYFDEMFMNCSNLESLNLSSFNTAAAESFFSMFEGCTVLKELPVSGFNTSEASDLSYMFKGCELVKTISIANFDTAKTRYIPGMFQNCSSAESIDLGEMETDLLSNVSGLFDGCESLKSIDLSTMKMQYAMDMSFMFRNCKMLETIDLSKMETMIPVRTMESMFEGCSSLVNIRMTEIESDILVSMASMFENCTSLKELALFESDTTPSKNNLVIKTENVQDMSRMFYGCEQLETLKLFNNMLYVSEIDDMLVGCVRLKEFSKGAKCRLITSYATPSYANLPTPDPEYIPGAAGYWYNSDKTEQYDASALPNTESDDLYYAVYGSVTYYPNGYDVDPFVDYLKYNDTYQIKGNVFQEVTKAALSSPAWNTNAGGTGTEYDVNQSYNTMIYGPLRTLKLYAQWKESPKATHSVYWKSNTQTLKVDSVVHGTTPEYTGAIPECAGSKFIGWSPEIGPCLDDQVYEAVFEPAETVSVTWDWDNAAGATPATKETIPYEVGTMPDYSKIPTKTDPDGIYTYTFIAWAPAVTKALKDTTYTAVYSSVYSDLLFWNYESGTLTISSSLIDGDIGGAFRSSLSYDGSEKAPWNRYRRLIRRIVVGNNTDMVSPFRMDGWFDSFENLTNTESQVNLDFTGLDCSKVKSMKALFRNCGKIQKLDISAWNTSSVESFEDMFSGCVSLKTLSVPKKMVTAKTVNVKGMFRNLGRLEEVDVSGFVTENVTDFTDMFAGCCYLTKLDVDDFDTKKGVHFDGMFADCKRVTALDVSGFETPAATSFAKMFLNCAYVSELNLGKFTVSVTEENIEDMFTGMTRIAKLTVGENCDLKKAGLPGPDPAYVEHADGYWHKDGKSYAPDKIDQKGTYGPIYGWITYDPNGRPGDQVVQYLKYTDKYYNIMNCVYTPAEGMKFAGWTEDKAGTGKVYSYSESLSQAEYEKLFGKTLYAQYKSIEKTDAKLTWKDWDGTVLLEETVPLQSKAKYSKPSPTRKSTAQYSYTFEKWDPVPGTVTEDTVFTAKYTETLRTYTVTWYNRDKAIVDRKFNVPYGTTPAHTTIIPTYESEKWNFTFKEWDRAPEVVVKDTSYEAVYTVTSKASSYTIRWVNWDNSLLLQETVQENVKPKGPTFTPVRPDTPAVSYAFAGWDSNVVKATEDHTYKATYTSTLKSYILLWSMNGHGTDVRQVLEVGTSIKKPVDPTAVGYTFGGWYYNAACTGSPVNFDGLTMPTNSLVIYAKWTENVTPGGGSTGGGGGGGGSISSRELNVNSGKATFSKFWTLNADGKWIIKDNAETILKNCWICDDAVISNRSNVWYLMKEDGTMLDAGLVQDQTGNYYSLEMRHEGYYGMLRYQDGYYDGVYLEFVKEHNGSYGAIKNADGIAALMKKYGVTKVNIGNQNIIYTSSLEK